MKTIDTKQIESELKALGFSIAASGPVPNVSEDNWPSIGFQVRLSFKDRLVLSAPYNMGVGHVKPIDSLVGSLDMTSDQNALLANWARKPNANFLDKHLWAGVACALAKRQKVTVTLPDLLYSLMLDGDAFFNAQPFEDWAGELGYDKDSRKAEKIWQACDDIGRKLARNVPAEVLAQVRELLQDY